MTYTAIDGDIAGFIDSMIDLTDEFQSVELLTYLMNEGYGSVAATAAMADWRSERFSEVRAPWVTFRLTSAGLKAVEELRDSLD